MLFQILDLLINFAVCDGSSSVDWVDWAVSAANANSKVSAAKANADKVDSEDNTTGEIILVLPSTRTVFRIYSFNVDRISKQTRLILHQYLQ